MRKCKGNLELKKTSSDRPAFVTRYGSRARKVFRIIDKYWSSMQNDHYEINRYIKNQKPMLTFRSNPSQAKRFIRAKIKRPRSKKNKEQNESSRISNNSSQSSNSKESTDNRSNESVDNYVNMMVKLADIRHNVDIGLKKSTSKCGDRRCPCTVN